MYMHGIHTCRSEGLPERDMESLGVMGWGLAVAENSAGVAGAALRVGTRGVMVVVGYDYYTRLRYY